MSKITGLLSKKIGSYRWYDASSAFSLNHMVAHKFTPIPPAVPSSRRAATLCQHKIDSAAQALNLPPETVLECVYGEKKK